MRRLLVIDDDKNIRYSFRRLFGKEYEVLEAEDGDGGLAAIEEKQPDLLFLDIRMPGRSGIEVLKEVKGCQPRLPTIVMTAFGDTETAIEAMRLGAFDYLVKPFETSYVRELVRRALHVRELGREAVLLDWEAEENYTSDRLVGRSLSMVKVYKAIGQIAETDVTVLLIGESGTGKELVARAIYHHSRRKDRPFLAVNCAAIPETLLESELFGYERGAFSGALESGRMGKFEQCGGGTIFLDEVGDMSRLTQAKVLRVLQDGSFERLGGGEVIRTNVRIIAASNKNLEALIESGDFREDLYHRLNVIRLEIPPLRERKEDIDALAHFFIKKFSHEFRKPVDGISPSLIEAMRAYDWPGNVRELENFIRRAVVMCRGPLLTAQDFPLPGLPEALPRAAEAGLPPSVRAWCEGLLEGYKEMEGSSFHEAISLVERCLIDRALMHSDGNRAQAARILGISRVTLRKKMEEYGMGGTESHASGE